MSEEQPPAEATVQTGVSTCPADATLTREQDAQLAALEGTTWEYEPGDLSAPWPCDLQAGHAGEHVAHLNTVDVDGVEADVWLRWLPGGDSTVGKAPVCEAGIGADDEEELCLLPDGHDGAHSTGSIWWVD